MSSESRKEFEQRRETRAERQRDPTSYQVVAPLWKVKPSLTLLPLLDLSCSFFSPHCPSFYLPSPSDWTFPLVVVSCPTPLKDDGTFTCCSLERSRTRDFPQSFPSSVIRSITRRSAIPWPLSARIDLTNRKGSQLQTIHRLCHTLADRVVEQRTSRVSQDDHHGVGYQRRHEQRYSGKEWSWIIGWKLIIGE